MSPRTGCSQSRSSQAYLRFGSFRSQKWTCVSTNGNRATELPPSLWNRLRNRIYFTRRPGGRRGGRRGTAPLDARFRRGAEAARARLDTQATGNDPLLVVSHLAVPSAPRGTTLAVALGLGCLCLAVPSGANVPGSNGLLVYEGLVSKHAQLFTIRSDGSGARQLTHFTDSDAGWPEWSPDGSAIAFERDVYVGRRVTRAVIYTMDADGSHLRALTPTGLNGRPSWSPDGRSIAFSTLSFGKQATVSIMPASGGR